MEKSVFHLSSSMKWLFPEYDFQTMDVESHKWVIIERILEKGSWDQARWLFDTYGEEVVADWVREHGFRLLSRRSFALWRLALGVKDFHAPEWVVIAREGNEW